MSKSTDRDAPAAGGPAPSADHAAEFSPEAGKAAPSHIQPVVVPADLATGLAGNYQESVAKGEPPNDNLSPVERMVLLATLGSGAEAIHDAQHHPDVFACPDDAAGATILTVLEETAPEFGTVVESPVDGKEVQFDNADLAGWVSAAWPLIKGWLNIGRVSFPPGPTEPTVIPNDARIAILGDWGTGLYGAPHCATSIEADPVAPQLLIHLGDVYYTGTEQQIRNRFLAPWPKVPGAVSRACNSNHEMLSGGAPYKNLTLGAFDQSSSLWWVQNDSWALIGLDTGWEDGTLGTMQLAWLEGILREAKRTERHTIAFSHHMPWRTDKHKLQPSLVDKVRHLLEERLLDGWYFGHEHLCALFERHPTWGLFGTCIGHSGYPYWPVDRAGRTPHKDNPDGSAWWRHSGTDDVPASYLLYGDNRFIKGHEQEYGPNGYGMLDLGDGVWVETIYEAGGTKLARRVLRPSDEGDGGGGDLL